MTRSPAYSEIHPGERSSDRTQLHPTAKNPRCIWRRDPTAVLMDCIEAHSRAPTDHKLETRIVARDESPDNSRANTGRSFQEVPTAFLYPHHRRGRARRVPLRSKTMRS